MRRLAHWLLAFCSGASLLVCAAACVLWAWSFSVREEIRHYRLAGDKHAWIATEWRVTAETGRVQVALLRNGPATADQRGRNADGISMHGFAEAAQTPDGLRRRSDGATPTAGWLSFVRSLGFYRGAERSSSRYGWWEVRSVTVPAWAIVLATSLLPAAALNERRRRSRRMNAAKCADCGYDLRARRDWCPECRAVAPAATASGDSAG